MTLQAYLSEFFYTKAQLLAAAQVPEARFDQWLQGGVMPQPSYTLCTKVACRSFFGDHEEVSVTHYYARAYVDWLALLSTTSDRDAVLAIFRARYRDALARLTAQGFVGAAEKLSTGLDAHIDAEWLHFISGTYGLCTRSGLPEDIAAKEIAIVIINELLTVAGAGAADATLRARLAAAVDLLDAASSPFAPHERERSSRKRLVDDVRAACLTDMDGTR